MGLGSVLCETPAQCCLCVNTPLSVMCKCGSLLDVFLICFAQNEDENRASESKKTKLEEKAPSGHKSSSSRE